ncbi:thiamine phosphate synthase [Vibrio ostreicida]|uniref:thiamine phosphate synthase n=1 Tax=Vibrio ostreicida TaxID=526588 RepID=UPI0009709166|nr:thiamine phosphate synthase [Vibrio ostreicida]
MILPRQYAITGVQENLSVIAQMLDRKTANDMSQVRVKSHPLSALKKALGSHLNGIVLLNSTSYDGSHLAPFHGLHLTSSDARDNALIRELRQQGMQYLAASCHNEEEIERANSVGCDFVTISPVEVASCHPQAVPIGWHRFEQLSALATMPTFALGGMSMEQLADAQRFGAYGVSGISDFW